MLGNLDLRLRTPYVNLVEMRRENDTQERKNQVLLLITNVIHGRVMNMTEVQIFPATTKIFNSTIFNTLFSLLLYINIPLSKEAYMQIAITI